jgi:hypothetical protein
MSRDNLERARQASAALDWIVAAENFGQADGAGTELSAADLESWAIALYMLGRVNSAVVPLSRAFQGLVSAEHLEEAARIGYWIAFMLLETRELAQAGGWMADANASWAKSPTTAWPTSTSSPSKLTRALRWSVTTRRRSR